MATFVAESFSDVYGWTCMPHGGCLITGSVALPLLLAQKWICQLSSALDAFRQVSSDEVINLSLFTAFASFYG